MEIGDSLFSPDPPEEEDPASGGAEGGAVDPFALIPGHHAPASATQKPIRSILKEALQERVREALRGNLKRLEPKEKTREGSTKFSTTAGKDHGASLGWTLLKSEGYDFRSKKWYDIQLGMDLLFQTPMGLVAVQCATPGQRKEHWERYVGLNGPVRAAEWEWRVEYWEFVRGNPRPVKTECWTE